MANSTEADIVIIGGGIWGLSTAYHLAACEPTLQILVLERGDDVAGETTLQAAGQIGQLRANPVMVRGVKYTLELMGEFQERTGHDPFFRRVGSLQLALTPERLEFFREQVATAAELRIEVDFVDDETVARMAPALRRADVLGAIFLPEDGYVDARRCALAYAAAARDLGVEIRTGCRVLDLVHPAGQITAVDTSQGKIETGCVVITVGPWARSALARAGIFVPMQPFRLQQARTEPLEQIPDDHPVVRIPDTSCYLRPEQGGYLFGMFDDEPLNIDLAGQPEAFVTANMASEPAIIDEACRRLAPVFPILRDAPIDQYRQGMVGCTPDGNYILGPVPSLAGIMVATGCGGMGIAGSAAVGRWLTAWITNGDPGDDLSGFAPDRFGADAENDQWVCETSRETFRNYYALSASSG